MKNQKSYEIIKQAVRNSMTVDVIKSTIERNPNCKANSLRSFYDSLFVSYFENNPEYKIQSLLSLLNLTARQKKVHGVSDVAILKIEFCENLIKELGFYMTYKEEEAQKEVNKFIKKVEKKLAKLKETKEQPEPQAPEVTQEQRITETQRKIEYVISKVNETKHYYGNLFWTEKDEILSKEYALSFERCLMLIHHLIELYNNYIYKHYITYKDDEAIKYAYRSFKSNKDIKTQNSTTWNLSVKCLE